MKNTNQDNRAAMDHTIVKNLTFDDVSELIFEIINIQFEECIGVDYFTGRYDTREQSLHLGPIFRTLVRFRTFLMKVVRICSKSPNSR